MRTISILLSLILILLTAVPAYAAIERIPQETETPEQTQSLNEENIPPDTDITDPSSEFDADIPQANTESTENEEKRFTPPKMNSIDDTDSGVKLSWNFQSGVFRYRVFTKSGSSWKNIGETSATTFIHKNAVLGTSYIYTVRAINSDSTYASDYNKTGWKHTYYLTTPKLKSVDYTNKGIKISWNKSKNAKMYRVFYKRDYFKSWKKLLDTTSNECVDSSLTNDIKYVYTVRCVNPDTGAWESDYDSKGLEIYYHTTPKLTDISGAATGVRVNWKAVGGIKYYKVYYKDNGSSWTLATPQPVTGTAYTFKTTNYRHKIELTVKCSDANGKSLSYHQSPGLSVEYLNMPKITSVSRDVSDMTLRWSSVGGTYKYRVFYYNGSTWKSIGSTSSTSFTYSDGYCDGYEDSKGGDYYFTVRCFDKYGKYVSGFESPGYKFKYDFVPKKQKVQLKCPYYSQNVMKAGCETYATVMLLHFFGFGISPTDFADEFVLQRPASFYNGRMYGPSMDSAFCGNVYNGWGINAKGMAKCINNYLVDRKSKLRATAYTGKSLQYLCNKYVAEGRPVLVWSTSQLTEAYVASRWTVDYTNGDDHKTEEEWYHGEHCLVLIGYDFPNRRYIYNDSLALDRSVGVSNWAKVRSEDRFETLGSQSIVIQ